MLYKPKYCSNCGEMIERTDWHFWTSRRFCQTCEIELKFYEWIPQISLFAGVLLAMFGVGGYLNSGARQSAVSSNINSTKPIQIVSNQTQAANSANVQTLSALPKQTTQAAPVQKTEVVKNAPKASTEDAAEEAVYFCGAETKKGTPCSRRVKGGGRCWQHEGREAMLPPDKLLAAQ